MPRPDDEFEDDLPRRRPRAADDEDGPPPRPKGNVAVVIGIVFGVLFLCCGGISVVGYLLFTRAKEGFDRGVARAEAEMEAAETRVQLTQIGNAIHKYHDAHGAFPNNTYENRGPQSRPLLSWRVHILPFLNQDALYRQFKLDEPWDSPNNRPLLARMPAVYASPQAHARAGDGKTHYRGFNQQGAVFLKPQFPGAPVQKVRIPDVMDGTSNTLLIVEAGEAVEWTRPDDLEFPRGRPRPALGLNPNSQFVMVLTVDGSPRKLRRQIADDTLRLLIMRADGQVLPEQWEEP
jgi:hypothetical protein